MNSSREKGVALIMTLILLGVLSAMAVSFMFLSQSETWSTLNYRLTSQARDAAEAGVNATSSYLYSTYTPPPTGAGCASDLLGCYTLTTYPVQRASNADTIGLTCSGATGCSLPSGVTISYPLAATQTAFNTDGRAYHTITNTVGGVQTSASWATYAVLLAMRSVNIYPSGTATVQTWQIVSDGTVNNGVRTATEEVSVILDKPIFPTYNFAAFASSNQCSALTFSQAGTLVESYDSSVSPAPGGVRASDGNVGTNGNLTISSNATIDGSLSTPATGTGSCTNGAGGASTAETACGGCTLAGGVNALPNTVSYPTPAIPLSPAPLSATLSVAAQSGNNSCSTIPHCTDLAAKKISLTPGTYGQVSVGAAMTEVHLTPGTYVMDSFATANVSLIIDSLPVDPVTGTKVILNVTGCATLNGSSTDCASYLGGNMIDFSSSGISNTSYNPANFQIQFVGTQAHPACAATSSCPAINVKCGNTGAAATVYAPDAPVTLSSNGSFYGSAIGQTVTVSSGATIYYDRNLQDLGLTTGNFMLGGFSWAKF